MHLTFGDSFILKLTFTSMQLVWISNKCLFGFFFGIILAIYLLWWILLLFSSVVEKLMSKSDVYCGWWIRQDSLSASLVLKLYSSEIAMLSELQTFSILGYIHSHWMSRDVSFSKNNCKYKAFLIRWFSTTQDLHEYCTL